MLQFLNVNYNGNQPLPQPLVGLHSTSGLKQLVNSKHHIQEFNPHIFQPILQGCSFQIFDLIQSKNLDRVKGDLKLIRRFSDRMSQIFGSIGYPETKKNEIFEGKIHKTSFRSNRVIRYFGYLVLKTDISDRISKSICKNPKICHVSDIFEYPKMKNSDSKYPKTKKADGIFGKSDRIDRIGYLNTPAILNQNNNDKQSKN